MASVLSLVYRVEAMDTNDGTWKYTTLLICNIVENDVAIIVASTPGCVNFTRLYIPKLSIVKSFRWTLGEAAIARRPGPSRNRKEDPNKPRTQNGSSWKGNQGFEMLSNTFNHGISLTERSEGRISLPMATNSQRIVRTVVVSQETNYPGSMPATGVQEPEAHN